MAVEPGKSIQPEPPPTLNTKISSDESETTKTDTEGRGSYEGKHLPGEDATRVKTAETQMQPKKIKKLICRLMKSASKYLKKDVNIMDSGADKHLAKVGEKGAWIATHIYGPINCEGFDSTVTKLELAAAETLAQDQFGNNIILEAMQVVIHELPFATSSLLDPSAMAEAGGDITLNFKTSIGCCKFGEVEIKLHACEGGIGFKSRQPSEIERRELKRIIISTTNYNKSAFMKQGGEQQTEMKKMKGKSTNQNTHTA